MTSTLAANLCMSVLLVPITFLIYQAVKLYRDDKPRTIEELTTWAKSRQQSGTRGKRGYTIEEDLAWLAGGGNLAHKDAKLFLKYLAKLKR